MIFYLTTPSYTALRDYEVPIFINRSALFGSRAPKKLPRARGRFAIDSGGYTELKKHGRWTVTPHQYVKEMRQVLREVGTPDWIATLDFMCEDEVLAKTGKGVEEHQELTVESYMQLRAIGGPELEHLWIPVLQGRTLEDYVEHFELYMNWGIDLRQVNVVGVGSVCRCGQNERLRNVFAALRNLGLRRLHGFGVKQSAFNWTDVLSKPARPDVEALYHRALEQGMPYELFEDVLRHDPNYGEITWEDEDASICKFLYSSDSAAWSSRARAQAEEVRAVRRALAVLRGHDPALVAGKTYVHEYHGELYFGRERVGRVLVELAGERAQPPISAEDLHGSLLPTQLMVPCAERAANYRGKGRTPHESCNQCPAWALEYRRRLQGQLEPHGCWDEAPKLGKLPPPSFEGLRRTIARTDELAGRWRSTGGAAFGPEAAAWARMQALSHYAKELQARIAAGEQGLDEDLSATMEELEGLRGRG